jgi:hypothetical protein
MISSKLLAGVGPVSFQEKLRLAKNLENLQEVSRALYSILETALHGVNSLKRHPLLSHQIPPLGALIKFGNDLTAQQVALNTYLRGRDPIGNISENRERYHQIVALFKNGIELMQQELGSIKSVTTEVGEMLWEEFSYLDDDYEDQSWSSKRKVEFLAEFKPLVRFQVDLLGQLTADLEVINDCLSAQTIDIQDHSDLRPIFRRRNARLRDTVWDEFERPKHVKADVKRGVEQNLVSLRRFYFTYLLHANYRKLLEVHNRDTIKMTHLNFKKVRGEVEAAVDQYECAWDTFVGKGTRNCTPEALRQAKTYAFPVWALVRQAKVAPEHVGDILDNLCGEYIRGTAEFFGKDVSELLPLEDQFHQLLQICVKKENWSTFAKQTVGQSFIGKTAQLAMASNNRLFAANQHIWRRAFTVIGASSLAEQRPHIVNTIAGASTLAQEVLLGPPVLSTVSTVA